MKELTIKEKAKRIKEKAKAYDEVLNKLRCFMAQGVNPLITRADVQDFFPELKESEDERIKKELIDFFQDWHKVKPSRLNVNVSDILAWLEKQELKSNPYSGVSFSYNGNVWGMCARDNGVDILFNKKLIEHISGEKQGEQKPIIEMMSAEESLGIDSATYNKIVDECIYGEQKPADKVEPFDKYEGLTDFERTLADICIGWVGKEIGWKQYIKDNADVLLKIAVEKFNSVQDAPFEQKSTDEEMKTLLRTEYEKGRADAIAEMQKPAWSEEDESYLNTTIAYLKDATEFKKTAENCIDWLKSLKPQNTWKPSDEQMKALKYVAYHLMSDNNYREEMFSLYEQLKKLKG